MDNITSIIDRKDLWCGTITISEGPVIDKRANLELLKEKDYHIDLSDNNISICTKISMDEIIRHLRTSIYKKFELVNHVSYRHFNIEVLDLDKLNEFLKNIGINKKIEMNNEKYIISNIKE